MIRHVYQNQRSGWSVAEAALTTTTAWGQSSVGSVSRIIVITLWASVWRSPRGSAGQVSRTKGPISAKIRLRHTLLSAVRQLSVLVHLPRRHFTGSTAFVDSGGAGIRSVLSTKAAQ
jgi:hypothetical protein